MIIHRCFACIVIVLATISTSRAGLLDNSTLTTLSVAARDVTYDSTRGVVYASVPSSAGAPYGNSIISIDPESHSILSHTYVGSEPNKLAISGDGSRVYVGIDGARSFTWWQPADNTVGSLVLVKSAYGAAAVVQSMAVSPLNPHVVVVSKNEVGSTASGDMEIFQDSTSLGIPTPTYPYNDANEIGFADDHTLVSYDDADTSYALATWNFTGTALSRNSKINGLISGFWTHMETRDGLIYASTGMVVDPATLAPLGTFSVPGSSAVEAFSSLGRTYFLGPRSSLDKTLTLQVFDNHTFLLLDSQSFPQFIVSGSILQLVPAGDHGLAFVTSTGQLGIINSVPEPSSVALFSCGALCLAFVRLRRRGHRSN